MYFKMFGICISLQKLSILKISEVILRKIAVNFILTTGAAVTRRQHKQLFVKELKQCFAFEFEFVFIYYYFT